MKNLFKKLFSFLGNKTQKEINNKLDIIISDLSLLTKQIKELNIINKISITNINNTFEDMILKSKDLINRMVKLKYIDTDKIKGQNIFVWDPNENKYKEYDKQMDFKKFSNITNN